MHAEIIAIGDELTSGQSLDTNSQWLSRRLEELGVRVLYHVTVGDEIEPCVEVFRRAIERSDVVIVTGGLGPTDDDLTRPALARAVGRELVVDPRALEHVRQIFARRNRPMPRRNEVQTLLPAGSRMIDNPHGTAPGIDLEAPRLGGGASRVFALPGVPAEMVEMWNETVVGALRQLGAGATVVCHKRINCFGAGESQIEAMLPELIRRGREPRVGITASQATIILRIAAEGPSEAVCLAAMEPTIATIRQCLGDLVFGEDDEQLQDAVVRRLRQRDMTLAVAEWGTGGLVTQWLAEAAGGEPTADGRGCFLGGMIVAADGALRGLLGTAAAGIEGGSACDPAVVGAMAEACRRALGADLGLAVGQFPSTEAGQAGLPTVPVALASAANVALSDIPLGLHPALLRTYCAKQALNFLRLASLPGGGGD